MLVVRNGKIDDKGLSPFRFETSRLLTNALRQGRLRERALIDAELFKFNSESQGRHRRSRPLHAEVRTATQLLRDAYCRYYEMDSIVITGLEKIDTIIAHNIYNTMLLS
jgi:hypothetical protein